MKVVIFRHEGDIRAGDFDPARGIVRELQGPSAEPIGNLTRVIEQGVADGGTVPTHSEKEYELGAIEILAPIRDLRRNIICVGKNYKDHSQEFSSSGYDASGATQVEPSYPVFFTKPASAIVGPDDPIAPHPHVTSAMDYEAEVAVIIGKTGFRIEEDQAWAHVWGYTLLNDVTARDLQQRHNQWFLGKSLDTFCPIGPWAVTADEVEGHNIDIECSVNGELRQRANTADLIFDIPTLIATLSSCMELHPGDVIATGTPAGVGIGFQPAKFLQPGDKVVVSSSQLGQLVNTVATASFKLEGAREMEEASVSSGVARP